MKMLRNLTDLIGNTPLIELAGLRASLGLSAQIFGKLENRNPGGSAKDRVALFMIDEAEKAGRLAPGSVIIEPTSGNTGIGLALVARARGYRTVLTMPESMSVERRRLLAAYGASLVLTPAAEGMKGAVKRAAELVEETPGSFMPMQFENPANALAHYKTTGPEIWRDTEGTVDIFVSAVGTGGTITGTGRCLKEHNPAVRVVAVEPAASAVLSGKPAGEHKIQGIGAGFVPKALDVKLIDEVISVTDDEAFEYARKLAAADGILAGISSGAALCAAVRLAEQPENAGKRIVVVLPDSGERYFSTPLFS